MTEAWRLGIPLEKAAVAFGCNPTTMRAHYIALDETAVSDEVLAAIAQVVRPVSHVNGQSGGSRGEPPSVPVQRSQPPAEGPAPTGSTPPTSLE